MKNKNPTYYLFILTTFANNCFFLFRKANKRKRKTLMRNINEPSQTLEHCQISKNILSLLYEKNKFLTTYREYRVNSKYNYIESYHSPSFYIQKKSSKFSHYTKNLLSFCLS